mgnify:CR=1 FL=1
MGVIGRFRGWFLQLLFHGLFLCRRFCRIPLPAPVHMYITSIPQAALPLPVALSPVCTVPLPIALRVTLAPQ